jgi:dCMP deaminase
MANKITFKKTNRISWDNFFMQIALTSAKRTACIHHKIASVFVDKNHRIVSIGYNGPSIGDFNCNEVGCAKVHGDPETGKIRRCRGAHAEINAIINAGDTTRLKGATLYNTTFPCYDCMKALNNLGIKRIVYNEEYKRVLDGQNGKRKEDGPETKDLARRRSIVIEKFSDLKRKEKNDSRR